MSAVRGGGTALLRDLADGRWVVGAAAASIVVWNCALRELPVSLPLVVAVFAATVVIYGLDAWLDRRSAPLPPAIGLSLPLALLLLVATLPFLRGMTCLALAIGLPICALYAIPLPGLRGRRPKDHPVGKVFSVAASVAVATTLLPAVESRTMPGALEFIAIALGTGVLIAWNTLACDLRDLPRDRRAELRTLATSLGDDRLRALLSAFAVVGIGALMISAFRSHTPIAGPLLFATVPLAVGLVALRAFRPTTAPWVWTWSLDGSFLILLLTPLAKIF